MTTRRQKRIARIVKEVASDAIANRLNDPRLEGFVSVTRVEISSDLHTADAFLSIFAKNDATKNKTFKAIIHAKSRIQSLLANEMQSRFCPVLNFHDDRKLEKTMETMKLIDQAAKEYKDNDLNKDEDSSPGN